MYKNYIFDFGKVLVNFEPEYMTRQYIKNADDIKIAQDVIFDRLYWDKLDAGTITDQEVIEGIKSRLPERLHKVAEDTYNHWYYHLPFIDGMWELVKDIKAKGGKLYLLSNISLTFAKNWQNVDGLFKLFSLFDGLVFSAEVDKMKPNKDIFEYLLSKYNLNASETVFIDDNLKNTKGAEEVGINGYLFDGDALKLRQNIL